MGSRKGGFASMDPVKRSKIASMGGVAAHAKGAAHEWTSKTAAAAGRKGGLASKGGRRRILEGGVDGSKDA